MKRQWECPHAELMWVKVDPWVIFPKNGHGHPPINRGQESPMMVTLPYPTIPNYNYIPCCDHGTCGDGEPITSFIQFSWSPPFGSWMTIRRNLNWHKIEDWNRKIIFHHFKPRLRHHSILSFWVQQIRTWLSNRQVHRFCWSRNI